MGFFDESTEDTGFFDGVSSRPPVRPEKAGERATLTAIEQDGGLEGLGSQLIPSIKNELEVYGMSSYEEESRSRVRAGLKGPLTDAALQTLEVETEQDAQDFVQTVQDESTAVDFRDEVADMIVNTLDSLPPESRQYDVLYQDIVNKTLVDRTMSDIINTQVNEEWDNTSGVDITLDFAEAIFGGQIITSRAFQTEVLDNLGLSSGSATEYVFKADDVDSLFNYVKSGETADDQLDRLDEILQVVQDTNSPLGENIVYRIDFISNLRAELEKKGAGTGAAAFDDIFDVTELGLLAKGTAQFLRATGAKLFGSVAAANKSLKAEDIEYIEGVMQEAVDSLAPSQGRVHPKGKVGVTELRSKQARSENGTLLDALANNNPTALNKVMNSAKDAGEDITPYLGVSSEGLASKLGPVGTADSGVHYTAVEKFNKLEQISEFDYSSLDKSREEFNKLVQEQNVSNILSEQELEKGVQSTIDQIYRQSGGVLHPQASWEALSKDGDFLKARVLFGQDGKSGYDTLSDAEYAMRNLFTDQGTVSARIKGTNAQVYSLDEVQDVDPDRLEYFIDVEVEHQVTSRDVNPLEGKVDAYLPFHSYLVPFSGRVEKAVVDSALAYTDKASRIATTMQDFTKPIGKLRGKKERDQWTRLLTHGDEHGVVFNKASAKEYLGGMSDRVWDAYVGTRSFYDAMGIVRNKAHRAGLSEQGYKGVRLQSGPLADDKGDIFGIPLTNRPMLRESLTDSDSLTEITGTRLYDSTSGVPVELTDEFLDSVYESDKIVIKNHRPVQASGELFDYSVVPRSAVTDLPHKTMNVRKGHIDLNYLGEDGFFQKYVGRLFGTGHKGGTGAKVLRRTQVVRNGIQQEGTEVVGIYKDTRQAEEAVQQLGDEGLEVVSTREAVSELGVDDAGTKSNVPSHARARGQRLLGPSGHAEISDVEDSLGRALAEARRYTGMDSVNVLKNKFMRTYGKYLEDADKGFPQDFARTRWRNRDNPEVQTLIRDAKAYHEYIKNQENALTGTLQVKFLEDLRASVAAWKTEGGAFQEFIGDATQSFLDKDFVKVGTQLTAGVFIAARPLYQTLANAAQSAFLFAQNPVRFTTYTVPRTLSVLTGIMLRGTRQGNVSMKLLGKTMGMSGDEFKEYIDSMVDSGMFSTGMVDDLFGLFDTNMKVAAGRNSLASSEFWKSMLPGGGLGGRAMSAAMIPQKISTDFSNLMAYVHATGNYVQKHKTVGVNTPFGKKTILGDARRLTFTQNRADQFTYQQNLWSVQFQFMHHVHKMFLDLVVDPAVNVATLGKKSLLRKGTNPWGGTFGQSAMTMGTIFAMFGLESRIGGENTTKITEELQKQGATPEMIDILMDGLAGKATEEMFGEELDLASRFSPIGFVSSSLGLMFTHDGALNLAGPAGSVWKTMGNMTAIAKAFHSDQEISDEEGALLLNEAANVFAGLKDYERYQVAMNFGELRTTSGRKIADINPNAAIPLLFSVPPKAQERYYETLDDIMDTQKMGQNVTKSIQSYLLNEMNNESWDALTSEKIVQYMQKGFLLADAAFSENKNAAQQVKRDLAKEFINPEKEFMTKYATKLVGRLSPEDSVLRLKQIKQNNPEQSAVIDQFIQLLQPQLEEE